MSENEIDQQKNQIVEGNDDLFKCFEQQKPTKQLKKPPAAANRNQINNILNELAH